ncbi:MAG: valine--tRNA ligase, partial [Propionibacterium sp.]|nr:valine--tRNA ligase [Propionibacterium sp.]
DTVVRLLAPYLPYATEEVWSWYRTGSVHRAPWPDAAALAGVEGDAEVLRTASAALVVLRRVKSEAKVSPRTPFLAVTVAAPEDALPILEEVSGDLRAATKIAGELTLVAFAASVSATDEGATVESVSAESQTSVTSFELGEAPARRKKD